MYHIVFRRKFARAVNGVFWTHSARQSCLWTNNNGQIGWFPTIHCAVCTVLRTVQSQRVWAKQALDSFIHTYRVAGSLNTPHDGYISIHSNFYFLSQEWMIGIRRTHDEIWKKVLASTPSNNAVYCVYVRKFSEWAVVSTTPCLVIHKSQVSHLDFWQLSQTHSRC